MNPIRTVELPREVEVPEDYIDVLVREANGEVVQQERIPFRSFTKNFIAITDNLLHPDISVAVTESNGTKRTLSTSNTGYNSNCGNANWGILVGTGSVAMDATDIKLSYCLNGTGINQLIYDTPLTSSIISSGSLRGFTFSRSATNLSTASINVTEAGILIQHGYGPYYYLIARDRFQKDGTQINLTVNPFQSIDVVYNFYIDVNQGFLDNWLIMMRGSMLADTENPVVPLCGFVQPSNYSTNAQHDLFSIYFGAGVCPTGICVGSGDTVPVSASSYRLESLINHGNSSGQLMYGGTTHVTASMSSVSQSMTSIFTRRFTNNSGDTVSIKEAGIVSAGNNAAQPNIYSLLIARKLTGTINLMSEETLDLVFLLSVSSSIT
ncbi:MAG: hypothetical protein WC306_03295 [Candidatus Paceibacterota bacterium]